MGRDPEIAQDPRVLASRLSAARAQRRVRRRAAQDLEMRRLDAHRQRSPSIGSGLVGVSPPQPAVTSRQSSAQISGHQKASL
jgi:hypothetical protein